MMHAQDKSKEKKYRVVYTDTVSSSLRKKLPVFNYCNQSEICEKQTLTILQKLHENGYLLATADSISSDSVHYTAYISCGKMVALASLKPGNIDTDIIRKAGYKEKLYTEKPFKPKQLQGLFENIITYYENRGFPFVRVQLDSVEIAEQSICATLRIDKGKRYILDSILVKGDAKITNRYLQNYLGIKHGMLYQESLIKNTGNKIKELPFLTEKRKPELVFNRDLTTLYLYLDKKRASRFSGVVGIQPDATGKTSIAGDARLQLQNPFGRGELLDFNWRRIQLGTQDLKTKVNYPFVFNTPFGADVDFRLYKRDTSFLEVNSMLGLRYMLSGNNYVKVFVGNKSSSVLSKQLLPQTGNEKGLGDVRVRLYGLALQVEKLDYRFNPTKGYRLVTQGSVGSKSILRNPLAETTAYETLRMKTLQYQGELEAELFFPLSRRNVLKLGNKTATLMNENIFENELFRFGGLLSMRGFDEEAFFASHYTVNTLEYRFILEQNSFFQVFADYAYYEKDTYKGFDSDTPLGIGAGISFDTRAGIFSLSYALGTERNNPMLIRSAKVHFGFINFF